MADLLFGDFAVMAGPAMEEEQFRLPDDFSKAYFYFPMRSRVRFSRGFSSFTTRMDRCREIASTIIDTNAKQRNSTNFLSQR